LLLLLAIVACNPRENKESVRTRSKKERNGRQRVMCV
jgi:hypothetical protein